MQVQSTTFLEKIQAAITAGRTPFADVYNDVELYFRSGLFISYVILRDLNSRHKPAHILVVEER